MHAHHLPLRKVVKLRRIKLDGQAFADVRVVDGRMTLPVKTVVVALLLKARRGRQHLCPCIQIFCRMLVAGFDLCGGYIHHGSLRQQRITHIHVVQQHDRAFRIALILHRIGDGKPAFNLTDGNDPA